MNLLIHIIRVSLLAILVATPWWFGGVWARVQWVLMLLVGVLLAMDLVERFGDPDRPNVIPTLWLPLLAGIGLGLFQLTPLPPGLADWLAPGTVRWRAELLEPPTATTAEGPEPEVASQPAHPLSWTTRSLYALATREYLALLLLATAVLAIASLHLADRESVLWFCAAWGSVGALLSFFGMVQRLSWNGKFYWVFEPLYGSSQSFGPFVNRNNAGGFLNLCLAAGLGLLVWVHWSRLGEPTGAAGSGGRERRRRRRYWSDPAHQVLSRRHSYGPGSGSRASRSAEEPAPPGDVSATDPRGEPVDDRLPQEASPSDPPVEGPPDRSGPLADDITKAYEKSRRRERFRSGSEGRRSGERQRRYAQVAYPQSYGSVRHHSGWSDLRSAFSSYLADLNAPRLGSLAIVSLTAGGVLCTASRGSILAMFAAAMVTASALALKGGNRRYALGLVVVLAAGWGFMAWAGQTDFVKARFDLLLEEGQLENGRLANWRESLQTVPQFWTTGTGLGTYRFVYERFQHRFLRNVGHFHAENQYIQALVEGGVLALAFLLLAILLTALAIERLYRAGGAINTVLAVTGTFGLVSQMVGGGFDFGMYIPSNMMLMAALCGIVIGRAALLTVWPPHVLSALDYPRPVGSSGYTFSRRSVRGGPRLSDQRQLVQGLAQSRRISRSRKSDGFLSRSLLFGLPAPTSLVTFVVGFLLLGCLFGSLEMNKAGRIESALREVRLEQVAEMELPELVTAAMTPLQTALLKRWDDALAHQRMAELMMQLYQAETYVRLCANQPEPASEQAETEGQPTLRDNELWNRASVWHLHGTIRDLQLHGDTRGVASLLNSATVQETLLPAARHLLWARQSAPTIPQLHLLLAELSPAYEPEADETVHLERCHLLAPGDATLWYWGGLLELQSGRVQLACDSWNRSLTLSPLHLWDVVEAARGQLTGDQLLNDVLPPRSDYLLNVVQRFLKKDDEKQERVRNAFLNRAEKVLPKTDLPPDQLAYVTARIYRLQDRVDEALPHYRRSGRAKPSAAGLALRVRGAAAAAAAVRRGLRTGQVPDSCQAESGGIPAFADGRQQGRVAAREARVPERAAPTGIRSRHAPGIRGPKRSSVERAIRCPRRRCRTVDTFAAGLGLGSTAVWLVVPAQNRPTDRLPTPPGPA